MLKRFLAWRRRLQMNRLIDDRTYTLAELCYSRQKLDKIHAEMNALIAQERGEPIPTPEEFEYHINHS